MSRTSEWHENEWANAMTATDQKLAVIEPVPTYATLSHVA